MLRRKGIPHRVVQLVPGFHPIALRGLGFPGGTVPALVRRRPPHPGLARHLAGAGRRTAPDPPLFPRDPRRAGASRRPSAGASRSCSTCPGGSSADMAAHHYEVRRWLAVDVSRRPAGRPPARPSLQARAFARAVGADEAAVRADLAALGGHLARSSACARTACSAAIEPNAADFPDREPPCRASPSSATWRPTCGASGGPLRLRRSSPPLPVPPRRAAARVARALEQSA